MPVPTRAQLRAGMKVAIVEKHNQTSGELSTGIVSSLLTNSAEHPHGIKVRLDDGRVGRVKEILDAEESPRRGPLVPVPPKEDYE